MSVILGTRNISSPRVRKPVHDNARCTNNRLVTTDDGTHIKEARQWCEETYQSYRYLPTLILYDIIFVHEPVRARALTTSRRPVNSDAIVRQV